MICEEIPKTRKEALDLGLSRYLGKPCKRGHHEGRSIHSGCIICFRMLVKNWNKDNPEKHKAAWVKQNARPEMREKRYECTKVWQNNNKHQLINNTSQRRAVKASY